MEDICFEYVCTFARTLPTATGIQLLIVILLIIMAIVSLHVGFLFCFLLFYTLKKLFEIDLKSIQDHVLVYWYVSF